MLENFLFGWVLYDIICIISFIVIIKNTRFSKNQINSGVLISCLIFFLLGTFGNAITADYPSYEEIIKLVRSTKDPFTHIEPFWISFIRVFGNSYLEYRTVLFFSSFVLFGMITCNLKDINQLLFISLFIIISIYNQIGLRAILFLMIYTLSLVYWSKKKFIASLILLTLSYFLHKVGPLGILTFFFSLFPLKKKRIRLTIIILTTFAIIINAILSSDLSFISEYMIAEDIGGVYYLVNEQSISETGNIIWLIIDIVTHSTVLLLSIIILILLWKYYSNFSSLQRVQYNLLFWTTAISFSIILTGLPDRTVAYRCAAIGEISLCYCWAILPIENNKLYRKYKPILLCMLLLLFLFRNIYIRGILNRI